MTYELALHDVAMSVSSDPDGAVRFNASVGDHRGQVELDPKTQIRPAILALRSRHGLFLLAVGERGMTADVMSRSRLHASLHLPERYSPETSLSWSAVILRESLMHRISHVVFRSGHDVKVECAVEPPLKRQYRLRRGRTTTLPKRYSPYVSTSEDVKM